MKEASQNVVPLTFVTENLKSQSSDVYSILLSINQSIKEIEIGRAGGKHEEEENACRVLAGKPEGNRPL
jgi:hypothetical protein